VSGLAYLFTACDFDFSAPRTDIKETKPDTMRDVLINLFFVIRRQASMVKGRSLASRAGSATGLPI
jgi:hypothetical protein